MCEQNKTLTKRNRWNSSKTKSTVRADQTGRPGAENEDVCGVAAIMKRLEAEGVHVADVLSLSLLPLLPPPPPPPPPLAFFFIVCLYSLFLFLSLRFLSFNGGVTGMLIRADPSFSLSLSLFLSFSPSLSLSASRRRIDGS